MSSRRGVVGVIVRRGCWLVIRRSHLVAAPGAYCFPGGGIQSDEDEPAALVRELTEELGVSVRPLKHLWQGTTPRGVSLSWWQAWLPEQAVLRPAPFEVAAVHWLAPDLLATLPGLLPSNRQFLSAWSRGEVRLVEKTAG
ncbi:MAG: NUDIX domain-containing protein [Pirellulales bacterium]|nr:NUDIX domain-containing protein [Pirellulales bacterium]